MAMVEKRSGFTLIELLIVIGVAAFLMVALAPIAIGAVRKSKAMRIYRNLVSMERAVEYYLVNERINDLSGSYPSTMVEYLCERDYIDPCPEKIDVSEPGGWKIFVFQDIRDGKKYLVIRVVYYWKDEGERKACERYLEDPYVEISSSFIKYEREFSRL